MMGWLLLFKECMRIFVEETQEKRKMLVHRERMKFVLAVARKTCNIWSIG